MMFGLFAGHLGADPEERSTARGKRVVVLRLAVKNRSASKDETVWCKCNIWHDRYDKMLPYLKKGSAIIVGGDLNLESYLARDGSPQSSLVISVESLKFSPFGKSDRTGVDTGSVEESAIGSSGFDNSDIYAGVGSGEDPEGFLSDNVPF
ncbi:MAG: single-stranded DNA-binding protein [Victivallaceae bacterium]